MALTVVIPAYNEESQIASVLQEVRTKTGSLVSEVIVVDDGSVDQTATVATNHGAKVVRLKRNCGYGAAIKAGIANASSDYIVTFDGDGQHDPGDIIKLYQRRNDADLIIGQRSSLIHLGIWRMPGRWLLKTIAEYLSGQKIPDLNSGMKQGRKEDLVRFAALCPDGMSFSDVLALIYISAHRRVGFVPINIRTRKSGKSAIRFSTGFETVLSILNIMMLFDPLRIFLPVATAFFSLGVLWGIPFALLGRGLSVGALLLILVGVLTFFFGMVSEQLAQVRKQLISPILESGKPNAP
jgi:glycosyltransferase involved in cell wall biosynthesis